MKWFTKHRTLGFAILFALIFGLGIFAWCNPGYEDFDTYTEGADGNGTITKDSSTKISWVNFQSRTEPGLWSKDHGAGHWGGGQEEDYTHKFEMQFDNVDNNALVLHYMLGSLDGDRKAHEAGSGDAVFLQVYDDTEKMYLALTENGSTKTDSWVGGGPQPATLYFVTTTRDWDGGTNNTGQFVAKICEVAHFGEGGSDLKDTLTVNAAVGEQNTYRFCMPVASFDDGGSVGSIDGFTQNLDLNEVAVGLSIPIADYHYRHH